MARGMQTRKRSRPVSFAGSKPAKRRRFARKRGRKATNFTSQSGAGGGLNYKSKKLSRRRWNNMLWNTTLMKEHYRSNAAAQTTVNSPASITSMTVSQQSALRFLGNQFYVATGGAIAPDATDPLPLFTGDIIIRGGKMGIRITNTFDTTATTQNSMQGVVMLVKTTKNYQPAGLPATVPVGWDTSLFPDFNTIIGKVVYRKTFLLRDADSANIEYRLKITKLDEGDYLNDFNTYMWYVFVGNVDVASARSMNITYYYNLSFAADATT